MAGSAAPHTLPLMPQAASHDLALHAAHGPAHAAWSAQVTHALRSNNAPRSAVFDIPVSEVRLFPALDHIVPGDWRRRMPVLANEVGALSLDQLERELHSSFSRMWGVVSMSPVAPRLFFARAGLPLEDRNAIGMYRPVPSPHIVLDTPRLLGTAATVLHPRVSGHALGASCWDPCVILGSDYSPAEVLRHEIGHALAGGRIDGFALTGPVADYAARRSDRGRDLHAYEHGLAIGLLTPAQLASGSYLLRPRSVNLDEALTEALEPELARRLDRFAPAALTSGLPVAKRPNEWSMLLREVLDGRSATWLASQTRPMETFLELVGKRGAGLRGAMWEWLWAGQSEVTAERWVAMLRSARVRRAA